MKDCMTYVIGVANLITMIKTMRYGFGVRALYQVTNSSLGYG